MPDFTDLYRTMYQDKLGLGYSHEQALHLLVSKSGCPKETALAIQVEMKQEMGVIGSWRPLGPVIHEHTLWYTGPADGDRFWPALRSHLSQKGWAEPALVNLDEASTKIMSRLQPPMQERVDTRGLVMGYVQSGKTASYTALIAKAADRNYQVFIVLTGIHNSLRAQTQRRLTRELAGGGTEQDRPAADPDIAQHWFTLTDAQADFTEPTTPATAMMSLGSTQRVLIVIKKNARVLSRLITWLGNAHQDVRSKIPVLVIDDEADQASVNTSKKPDKVTRINGLIRKLLEVMPRSSYVAYTATPFANLLINPDPALKTLYPRHFILSLDVDPKTYFGPERVFGRDMLEDEDTPSDGMDVVRIVDDAEATHVRKELPQEDRLPGSMQDAVRWFLLASAARLARKEKPVLNGTMLVHTTLDTRSHRPILDLIKAYVGELRKAIKTTAVRSEFERLWLAECNRVSPDEGGDGCTDVKFDQLWSQMDAVIGETCLGYAEDNYISSDRLTYDPQEPSFRRFVIVVGGNTLSRGLTLEGLTVSYYLRTSNTYDTLLQMGRWFGYRPGYGDLFRIWTTQELRDFFGDIATVEEEIRRELTQYETGLTPEEHAVRIRRHPHLQITAAPKMQAATDAQITFSGRRVQSILYSRPHLATDWLAGDSFVKAAGPDSAAGKWERIGGSQGSAIARRVPSKHLLVLLDGLRQVGAATTFRCRELAKYIRSRNAAKKPELLSWNVVVVAPQTAWPYMAEPRILGGQPFNAVNRSRIDYISQNGEDVINLKVLIGPGEMVLDLPPDKASQGGKDEASVFAARQAEMPEIGLVLLYPIGKESIYDEKKRKQQADAKEGGGKKAIKRLSLGSDHDILGVALVFPRSSAKDSNDYVAVDLTSIARAKKWDDEQEVTDDLDLEEQGPA